VRQNFNYYFRHTRSERNGLFGITILTCMLWAAPETYPFFQKKLNKTNDNNTNLFKELIALEANATRDNLMFPNDGKSQNLFSFNPNTADMETLTTLGLTPKVATTLVHFREKGGVFFQKEDLKKIYGLKTEDYERLESYIDLETTHLDTPKGVQDVCQKSYVMIPFDPNTVAPKTLLLMGMPKLLKFCQIFVIKTESFIKNKI
jgi:competence protein ComEA